MKIATFSNEQRREVMGALIDTSNGPRLLALGDAVGALMPGQDGAAARAALGDDVLGFVRNGERALAAGRAVMDLAARALERGGESLERCLYDPSKVRFLAPVARPGKIIAVGANYPSHVDEISTQQTDAAIADVGRNLASGEYPPAFVKLASSLVGHEASVPYPRFTTQLDYEAELAFVIGRDCKDVAEDEALDVVAGYMIANDMSARDVQFKEMKRGIMVLGKNFQGAAPMGPWFVTRDEVPDYRDIEIRCWVNGELRQSDRAARMIHSIPRIIAFWSQAPLEAGDVFLTGSPAGVAIGMPQPEKFLLRPGDRVEIEMTGLGRLVNTVVEG